MWATWGSTRPLPAPRSPGQGEQRPKFHSSGKVREAPAEQRAKAAAQFGEQSEVGDSQLIGATSITAEIMEKADMRFH